MSAADRHALLMTFTAVTKVAADTPCEGFSYTRNRPCRMRAKYHYEAQTHTNGRTGNYCVWHLLPGGTGYDIREPLGKAYLESDR